MTTRKALEKIERGSSPAESISNNGSGTVKQMWTSLHFDVISPGTFFLPLLDWEQWDLDFQHQ